MVDAHALGACGCGRAGSNPASPAKLKATKELLYCLWNGTVSDEHPWYPDNGLLQCTTRFPLQCLIQH